MPLHSVYRGDRRLLGVIKVERFRDFGRWTTVIGLIALTLGCVGPGYKSPGVSSTDVAMAADQLGQNQLMDLPVFARSSEEYGQIFERVVARISESALALCTDAATSNCNFSIALIDDVEHVNAYAGENSTVFIFTGLLQFLQTEDEIAAVFAHELGHHIANHIEESKQNADTGAATVSYLAGGVFGLLVYSLGGMDGTPAAELGESIGRGVYSKEQETEADLLSVYLLERAGYDAEKAIRVWEVLYALSAKTRTQWNDTHPSEVERYAHWKRAVSEVRANPAGMPHRR